MTTNVARIDRRPDDRRTFIMATTEKLQNIATGYLPIVLVCTMLVVAVSFSFWFGATLKGIEKEQAVAATKLAEIQSGLKSSQEQAAETHRELANNDKLLEIRVRHLEVEAEVAKRMQRE